MGVAVSMHRTGSEDHAATALIRLVARNLARRLYDNPNSRAGKPTGVGGAPIRPTTVPNAAIQRLER